MTTQSTDTLAVTEESANQTAAIVGIAMRALNQLRATYRCFNGPAQHALYDLDAVSVLIAALRDGEDHELALDQFRHTAGLCPFGHGHRNLNCRFTCLPPSSTLVLD